MRYLSLFSGIEAATVAWEPMGWEPMAFSEIDGFACALLEERYPNIPNLGDIRDIDWGDFIGEHGRPDLIVGGSPCQSFSLAGGKTGLNGVSRLMFEYVRAVQELRPEWVLWENVPHALTVEHGEAFKQLLCALDECGYGLAWRVLDAQFTRVPMRDGDGRITGWVGPVAQGRRRVFVVGHLGDGDAAPEILFEQDCLSGSHRQGSKEREAIKGASGERLDGLCGDARWAGTVRTRQGKPGGGKGVLIYDEVTGTLSTSNDQVLFIRDDSLQHSVTMPDGTRWTVRKMTPLEWERLMGFPDGYTDISGYYDNAGRRRRLTDNPRYRALGNSMAVNVMRFIGERIDEYERKASMPITVKIKRLYKNINMPSFAHVGDAGFDLQSTADVEIAPGGTVLVGTGIAIEVPYGYEAQMRPRSGMATKRGISLANTPGTIDAGYRGEVKAALHNISVDEMAYVKAGERIAQIVINKLPQVELVEVDELSDSERSTGGFGSTGAR